MTLTWRRTGGVASINRWLLGPVEQEAGGTLAAHHLVVLLDECVLLLRLRRLHVLVDVVRHLLADVERHHHLDAARAVRVPRAGVGEAAVRGRIELRSAAGERVPRVRLRTEQRAWLEVSLQSAHKHSSQTQH